jgi:hypothetical protein
MAFPLFQSKGHARTLKSLAEAFLGRSIQAARHSAR